MASDLRGDRLIALRELEGITQADLATALGVSAAAVSQVAKGDRPLPAAWAQVAAETYKVPVEFFAVAPSVADRGVLTFKKKSTARVRDERRVGRLHGEAARLFQYASSESGYHPTELPDPREFDDDPETIAEEVRRRAGLAADDPVPNVTRLCEQLGVGVVDRLDPRAQSDVRHSGVSRPTAENKRPLIAIAEDLAPALKRFVLAHELFHLIADQDLDRPLGGVRHPSELRANRFAGALLLPRAAAEARVNSTMTLHGLLRIKADYGVEVKGLIHRAKDLRIITPDRERSLYIQWSSSGWRTAEPVEVANERPLLLAQALRRVDGRNYAARLSHNIGVPAQLISHWTEVDNPPNDDSGATVISMKDRRRP